MEGEAAGFLRKVAAAAELPVIPSVPIVSL